MVLLVRLMRVYDDGMTREKFDLSYEHTLDGSLSDAIEYLKRNGLLMVTAQTD